MKTSKRNAAKRLIPLGAVAIAAGCGGGAHSALPVQSDAAAPGQQSHATTTALLTVRIPARGTAKAKRAPKYISQGSAALGYSIAPSGSAQPAEAVTALPSPGPVATSVTLPVTAPVGTDTVAVHIYDALPSPGASATPNVLSEGTATATVAAGQSSPLNVEALGVAYSLPLTIVTTAVPFFQNHPVAQATTVPAVPTDADGYAITGTLANPVTLTLPAGFSASPAVVASAGPVAITYAAGSTAPGGYVTTGLPGDIPGSGQVLTLAPMQLFFFETIGSDGNDYITAVNPITGAQVTSSPLSTSPGLSFAAVAGCTSGETMVISSNDELTGTGGTTTAFTVPTADLSVTPTVTDLTSTIAPNTTSFLASGLAADSSCGVYSINGGALTRYAGFPNASGTAIATSGWTANSSLGIAGSTIYGTTQYQTTVGDGGTGNLYAQSLALTGGAATQLGSVDTSDDAIDLSVLVGGVHAFDSVFDCAGDSGLTVYSLSGGIAALTTPTISYNGPASIAVSPDGSLYVFTAPASTASALRGRLAKRVAAAMAARRLAASANRAAAGMRHIKDGSGNVYSVNGIYGAVSADGRVLAVLSDTNAVPTVQFFQLIGDVPTVSGPVITLGIDPESQFLEAAFPH